MEKILIFSYVTIIMLLNLIIGSKFAMRAKINEYYKIIILSAVHFIIYCLIQYAFGFIQWTIRLNKFDNYPYKNPFCMLVIIYCIISLIALEVCYIKYGKNKYGIENTALLLFVIHVIAIFFVVFFSPINYFF